MDIPSETRVTAKKEKEKKKRPHFIGNWKQVPVLSMLPVLHI